MNIKKILTSKSRISAAMYPKNSNKMNLDFKLNLDFRIPNSRKFPHSRRSKILDDI